MQGVEGAKAPSREAYEAFHTKYAAALFIMNFIDPYMALGKLGKTGTYRNMKKITKGHRGAIQAHHLMEVRHLERLGLNIMDAPAVVLTRGDHVRISNQIYDLLPTGMSHSTDDIMNAYQQVYKNYPEWMQMINNFMGF